MGRGVCSDLTFPVFWVEQIFCGNSSASNWAAKLKFPRLCRISIWLMTKQIADFNGGRSVNLIVLFSHDSASDWLIMLACSLIVAIMSSSVYRSCLHNASRSRPSVPSLFLTTLLSLAISTLIGWFPLACRSFFFPFSFSFANPLLNDWLVVPRFFVFI